MTEEDGHPRFQEIDGGHRLRDLVLGTMPEDEREELEEALLLGDEGFEDALAEEAELLDAYARGELAPEDRERVDELLAHSQRLKGRAVTARVLAAAGDPGVRMAAGSGEPWVRWGSIAAGLVVACVAGWLMVQNLELRSRAERVEAELAALSRRSLELEQGVDAALLTQGDLAQQLAQRDRELEDLEAKLASALSDESKLVAVSFVLASGVLRGLEAPTRHVIPESADAVRFQLDLEEDAGYPRYRVSIRKQTVARSGARTALWRKSCHGAVW